MKLDDFVSISGMGGVYRLAANRNNGLIVEDLDSGKKKFVSARKHQFTPLASIGIYTDDDTTEMATIFTSMLTQIKDNPPPPLSAPTEEITDYFTKILPEYDRDRVYISDIKKVIKWFTFLHDRNLLNLEDEAKTENDDTPAEVTEQEQQAAEQDSPNA